MFELSVRRAEHVRHYVICAAAASAGWEVLLEEDRAVMRRAHYEDWHRVERARAQFESEVAKLREDGWRDC